MKKEEKLQLGSVVSAGYYSFQEIRKSQYNRIRNIIFRKETGLDYRELQEKKKKTKEEKKYLEEYKDSKLKQKLKNLVMDDKLSDEDREYIEKIMNVLSDVEEKEKEYEKLIKQMIQTEPIWIEFAEHIKGLGHIGIANLMYYFGYCEKATYPSSLWAFAGLTPDSKLVKGETAGFNRNCRTALWKIGDVFIKHRTPRYRPIYDKEKKRQLKLMEKKADNAPTRLGHADARARRKMIKFFLTDYYVMCKTLTKQKLSKPYVVEKMGHKHYDDILVYMKTLR